MRIGPICIKLKSLLCTSIAISIPVYLRTAQIYNDAKIHLQSLEQEQITAIQVAQEKIENHTIPNTFVDVLTGDSVELEQLKQKCRVLIFSDSQTFLKYKRQLNKNLNRFNPVLCNVISDNDGLIGRLMKDENTYYFYNEYNLPPQICTFYGDTVVHWESLSGKFNAENTSQVIIGRINKVIEKEFLSKLKF